MLTERPMGREDALDSRGLIAEAFRIEGVSEPDCRSIFFDWALGMSSETDLTDAIAALLARHADAPADHPMRQVLLEGLNQRADGPGRTRPRRRNARRAGAD